MYMRYTHFSKMERLELSILLKKGYSRREIGRALGRSHSSVIRELKKNQVKGGYDSHKAHHKARVRRTYSKYQGMKIRENPYLEQFVKQGLEAGWTPEQIAGRLREAHWGKTIVSAKGIYKWLYSVYGYHWCQYLPSRRYHRKHRRRKKSRKILIPNRVFIEERPRGAQRRSRRGHFEGDTLGVPRGSPETLAAVVDRASRYFLAVKIARLKYAVEGYGALLDSVAVRSLTLDNGVENVRYEELNVSTYFCHPHRAWEKPTIENTFQRLRRWIPKKARLRDYTDEDITAIVERMNNTPRKCLNYRTPQEVFKGSGVIFNHNGCCT